MAWENELLHTFEPEQLEDLQQRRKQRHNTLERRREMADRIHMTLIQQGSVRVRCRDTGSVFTIETGKDWGLRWYSVLVNGVVVPGMRKKLFERETLENWFCELELVEG